MTPLLAAAGGTLSYPIQVYIHEKSHDLAARAVYQSPHTAVVVQGILGVDSYFECDHTAPLSRLGNLLGRRVSFLVVVAAGPLVELGSCLALSILFPAPLTVFALAPALIHAFTLAIQPLVNTLTSRPVAQDDYGSLLEREGKVLYGLSLVGTAALIAKTIEPLLLTYPPLAVLGAGGLIVLTACVFVHKMKNIQYYQEV